MSEELIAKARAILVGTTPARQWKDEPGYNNAGIPTRFFFVPGHNGGAQVEMIAEDSTFCVESRTLLPALADLAESEGKRADGAEAGLANERGASLFMRGYDQAREDLMRSLGYPWIDLATCRNISETIRGLNIAERIQMMMAELANLKGKQP